MLKILNRQKKADEKKSRINKKFSVKPVYRSLPFNAREIHYTVVSKSESLPLLVFVHGAPGAWRGYMNLLNDPALQSKYKMISVDRLGYGRSGYGNAELSTEQQALSIKSIIEKENTNKSKVTLFGRSYGAPITALLAINYPEHVSQLFMISPVIDPSKEKFFWFSEAGKWKAIQWLLPKKLNVATAEKFAHQYEMKMMIPKWKFLSTPTTVITGERDKIADTANFAFAKEHLTNCDTTLIKLKNVGHQITYKRPDLIRGLLLNESMLKVSKAA